MKKIHVFMLITALTGVYTVQSNHNIQCASPYSTDEYIYSISQDIEPIESLVGQLPGSINIQVSDNIEKNHFNTGQTRIKISMCVENSKLITTTETWTTRNPIYLTWSNVITAVLLIPFVQQIMSVNVHNRDLSPINELLVPCLASLFLPNEPIECFQTEKEPKILSTVVYCNLHEAVAKGIISHKEALKMNPTPNLWHLVEFTWIQSNNHKKYSYTQAYFNLNKINKKE